MARARWLAALAVAVAGYGSPGVMAFRAGGDEPAKLGVVPEDGTYGLFRSGEDEPEFRVPLKKGQPLGFDSVQQFRPDDARVMFLYGVAGPSRLRLDLRSVYEWRRL